MDRIIDVGAGPPVVLVPGVQGRWEWMAPAIDALARSCRVLSFSLAGEPGSERGYDPERGFDDYVDQIEETLTSAGVSTTAVCGVSFGGLIALRWAACRPRRTTALVLVSTPAPEWRPDCRIEWYLRAPTLLSPLFAMQSPFRLGPEIWRAFDNTGERLRFATKHLATVARHPFSPSRMAERARLMRSTTVDFTAECSAVSAPTLVVTGEEHLDRVVSVSGSRTYARRIRDARPVCLDRSGHIGLVTRPEEFARTVGRFVADTARPAESLRRPA